MTQAVMDKRRKLLEPVSSQYRAAGKLEGKAALVTGGDSGIGRSVAIYFAKEGADVAIVYHESDADAQETQRLVEQEGRQCLLVKGDLSDEQFCHRTAKQVHRHFGKLDILVNNAGMQAPANELADIPGIQVRRTFEVNIFSIFYLSQAVLPLLEKNGTIINTTSVTAYRGSTHLIDYSATKGAIVSFTRSLSRNLATTGIRVNAVAPGPVWTPLVLETFDEPHLKKFGQQTAMERAGFPYEIAPAYVFLASSDASYITGQVIHVNGGEIINS